MSNYFTKCSLDGCFWKQLFLENIAKAFPKIWLHAETLSQIMWNMLIMFAFFFQLPRRHTKEFSNFMEYFNNIFDKYTLPYISFESKSFVKDDIFLLF